MEFSSSKVLKNVVFMKEKAHVGFRRHCINKTDATSTFPLTVPIILDHPVEVTKNNIVPCPCSQNFPNF